MATVLLTPGHANVTDVLSLQADAVALVTGLAASTSAVASCALVTAQITSATALRCIVPSTLTRNEVLTQLRMMENKVMSATAWPPT